MISIATEKLNSELADHVEALAAEAEKADGIAPLSEEFLNGLRDERLNHTHYLAREDDDIVGVAALNGDNVEMFVVPGKRRQGIGSKLYSSIDVEGLQAWAHGNLPGAQALAQQEGLEVTRTLLVMAIDGEALTNAATLNDVPLTPLNYSQAVEQMGREEVEKQWLQANNEAFSWHPEQGGWDLERLHRGMEADWFDPEDVLFLWDTDAQTGATMAGFHWTKWHTEETPGFGEVYVVGLAKDYRGQGLGDPLLRIGLARMVEKGADRVILYVEADNEPAVKAYEKLGFKVAEEHCVWA
ncbi:mycothiol synthase [Corynebacterium camporealensis]|uniref:mycothiol synthase n=1 Tax=Corynebacterium camporealensis TaxID=161896 RepID=UPI0034CD9786